MKLGSLGHHGYFFQEEQTVILIDPLLLDSFGSNPGVQFKIVPSREIDIKQLATVQAIFLTSEHIQRFQPSSFQALKNQGCQASVFVHAAFPKAAVKILEFLDFKVIRMKDGERFRKGDIEFAFFNNSDSVDFWDRRVASLIINNLQKNEWIYVQSDTLPSKKLIDYFRNENVKTLTAAVLTHNSFQTLSRRPLGLENIIPLPLSSKGPEGLRILNSLVNAVKNLPLARHLLISGCGFLDNRNIMGGYRWPNKSFAELGSKLMLNCKVSALDPGDCIDFQLESYANSQPWICTKSRDYPPALPEREPDNFGALEILTGNSRKIEEVQDYLKRLSKPLLLSLFGQSLLEAHQYLGMPTGSKRFVIQILRDRNGNAWDCEFDLSRAGFFVKPYTGNAAIRIFPYGLRLYNSDFFGLFSGKIQIWEVSLISARQWYIGKKERSPMGFLYSFFDEGLFQEKAYINFKYGLNVVR